MAYCIGFTAFFDSFERMFLKIESYRKGIVVSTVFNIINKGFVFLNTLVIAYYFGAQIKIDIYFYAYNTILIIAAFITNLNATVLIPESMRIRAVNSEKSAMLFINFFLYAYGLFTLMICLLFLIDPVHAFVTVSSFKASGLHENSKILLYAAPLVILIPIVNLLTDVLTSYKFFSIPMIAGIINGIFSILFILLLHDVLNVLSLVFGLLLSNILNFILLIVLMKRKLHWSFAFKRIAIEKRIWKNIGFAQAGNITSSLTAYLPLYLLSGFGPGIITSLNFAQQISSLPNALITNQFSSVAGIKFNELYSRNKFVELNDVFISTSNFLLFILIPISGIIFIYPTEIVMILLKRGAFGSNGVVYTSLFLQWLGLLAPTLVINTLFARLFMASHKIFQGFSYQIAFNIVLLGCIYGSVRQFGIIGYPVTWVSAYFLNVVFCYFLEKRYFNIIRYHLVLKKFFLFVVVNLFVGLAVYECRKWANIQSNIISLACGSTLYLLLIVILSIRFELNDNFNLFLQQFWKTGLRYAGIKK
jgi:putative peptidoglycan lipid II flippase